MSKRVSAEQALEELRDWVDDLCEDDLADEYAKLIAGGKWEWSEDSQCLVEVDEIEEAVREIIEDVKDWMEDEMTSNQALEATIDRRRADLERTIKEARDRLAAVPQLAEAARQRIATGE
jgi:ATP/maltotriose-dependent transcriptional regulator MalT